MFEIHCFAAKAPEEMLDTADKKRRENTLVKCLNENGFANGPRTRQNEMGTRNGLPALLSADARQALKNEWLRDFDELVDWVYEDNISQAELCQRLSASFKIMEALNYNQDNYAASTANIQLSGYNQITKFPRNMKVETLCLRGFHNMVFSLDGFYASRLLLSDCSHVTFERAGRLGESSQYHRIPSVTLLRCQHTVLADGLEIGFLRVRDCLAFLMPRNAKVETLLFLGKNCIVNRDSEGILPQKSCSYLPVFTSRLDSSHPVAFVSPAVEALLTGQSEQARQFGLVSYNMMLPYRGSQEERKSESSFATGMVEDMLQPVIHPKGNNKGFFMVEYSELLTWWLHTGCVKHPISKEPFNVNELRRLVLHTIYKP